MKRDPEALRSWTPILMYHRVVPELPAHDPYHNCITVDAFDKHLSWLSSKGYRSASLAEIAAPQSSSTGIRKCVITFDDGYLDNYEFAWPLLRKHGFTAIIYIVTDLIGGINEFDASIGEVAVRMLAADQIREMRSAGIRFGSHSCSHPESLTKMDDDSLSRELSVSRATLEELLQEHIDAFAYPHSQHDERTRLALQAAGYRYACAGVGTGFSPLALHRVDAAINVRNLGAEIARRHAKWAIRKALSI